jgi:hypothetical protein
MPTKRYSDDGLKAGTPERELGIRLHRIFERSRNVEELHSAINALEEDCLIGANEALSLRKNIEQAMENPTINEWFTHEWDDIKNEAEIITPDDMRRPDRVMIEGRRAVVVDYKFGHIKNRAYERQVGDYMRLIEQMGLYDTIEGYVWYISLGEVVALGK